MEEPPDTLDKKKEKEEEEKRSPARTTFTDEKELRTHMSSLYKTKLVTYLGDKEGSVRIVKKDKFTALMLQSSNDDQSNLLKRIIKQTAYACGVTTFIASLEGDALVAKANTDPLCKKMKELSLDPIEDPSRYVSPKKNKDDPAALGTAMHYIIQQRLVKSHECDSPLPLHMPSEAGEPCKDGDPIVHRCAEELLRYGFKPITAEYPVCLSLAPVQKGEGPKKKKVWRWLTGKIDLIAWHADYGLVLVDFKFTKRDIMKRQYALQLRLLALCLRSFGVKTDAMFLVSLEMKKDKSTLRFYKVPFSRAQVEASLYTFLPKEDAEIYKSIFAPSISDLE